MTSAVDAPPRGPSAPLRAAARALEGAGLAWVLLRPRRAPAPGVVPSGDVDILVSEVPGPVLDALLAGAGFRRLPGTGPPPGAPSRGFYIAYDDASDEWVALDVVTEAAFGRRLELHTAVAGELLSRRRRVHGVNLLDPDDGFWHLLLHRLLDKPGPPQGHAALAARAARARAAGPLAGVVDVLRPGGRTAAGVLALVGGGDPAAIDGLAADLRAAWRRHDGRRVRARAVRSVAARAHLVREAPAAPTGLAVAILGPDGAGKTTLAEALVRSLPVPARRVYMGVWRSYPWDRWLRFLPGARLALRCARLGARSLQSSYHRRRGRIVLLDRFTYEAALPSDGLDWRGKVTAAIAARLAPAPDAILLLDAPPEVMYARKGEQGLDLLARDSEAYRRLVAGRAGATVIDATLPAEQVRTCAHRALWELLGPGDRGDGT